LELKRVNKLSKFFFATCLLLACVTELRSQPLAINTMAGSGAPGIADGFNSQAEFNNPTGIAVDGAGNVFVADSENGTIRKISPNQVVLTFAGSAGNFGSVNGSRTNARFFGPQGIAVDSAGALYVADSANATIRKITTAGEVSTLAGFAGTINSFDGAGTNANFFQPQGIAVDNGGNVYVTDSLNHTIRKISPAGVVSTLAGLAGNPGGSDGTNSKARFNRPAGIAVDSATNLFVTDSLNHTIRKITPEGVVSTIAGLAGVWGNVDGTNSAARFFQPQGIVMDNVGNLFVTDSGNQTVRKISPSGTNWIVTSVAGLPGIAGDADGAGDAGQFYFPSGIAKDGAGHFYFADSGNNAIRADRSVAGDFYLNFVVNPLNAGTVVFSPDQPSPDAVSLTAMVNPGYSFAGWTGDAVTTNNPVNVVMTSDKTLVANFISAADLILDNPDASYSGVWTIGSASNDKFGSYYQYAPTTTSGTGNEAHARYTPNITTPGKYDVFIWYPEGTNRTSNALVSVTSGGETFQTNIDQRTGGGSWHLIAAAKDFAAGTGGFVEIGNVTGEADKIVVADAVRFAYRTGPVIFSQPHDLTERIGSSASFNVLAAGSGQLTYQWQFNDVDIAGATNSFFTRTNLQADNFGGYTVVISNEIASVISDIAGLYLLPPVQFGSFSVLSDGRFQFTFNGDARVNYAIEASTNLHDWIVLTNFSSPDGILEFTDPEPNLEKRFYRARSSP
jgi:uncharacterized repeat protein (TIGR02543 family)